MVDECAECTAMTVSAGAMSSIEAFAAVVVLNTSSSPMVDSFAKTRITSASHEDQGAFSAAACDGSASVNAK